MRRFQNYRKGICLKLTNPASPEYGSTGNKFNGDIHWVKLEVGDDSHDHLISAEDRLNMAMAKQ
ncbi:arylsulfatase [Niastella yeongjuensis]|nr:arylsulfatase [Niastella yeongjuensis]